MAGATSASRASSAPRKHKSTPRLKHLSSPARKRTPTSSSAHRSTAATFPRIRSQRQSTLTQLDFASSAARGSDSDDEDQQNEWEMPATKKRRRSAKLPQHANKSQNTLTQMPFLVCPDSDQSESEAPLCDDMEFVATKLESQSNEDDNHVEPQSPQLASPSQRGQPFDIAVDSSPHIKQEEIFAAPVVLDTPKRHIKAEIPSSQSTALTSLTRSRSVADLASGGKRPRMTLGEMTLNELMRRDANLENTPRKQGRRGAVIQDSCDEDDDELYDADAENMEPAWAQDFVKHTPKSKANGEGSSKSGSSAGSPFDESLPSKARGRHSASPTPQSQRNLQFRHPKLRDSGFDMDLDDIGSSLSARRNRVASSPAGLQLEMMQEQNADRAAAPSPMPRRTLFKAPAPPPRARSPLRRKDSSTTRVPSSQATTVDLSIQSPSHCRIQVPSSPLPSWATATSSTPAPPLPASCDDSQTQDLGDWRDMTALSAVQSSGQLVTVSQLLGDSQDDSLASQRFYTPD